eukprot:2137757-Prymnesium_polylepis.1
MDYSAPRTVRSRSRIRTHEKNPTREIMADQCFLSSSPAPRPAFSASSQAHRAPPFVRNRWSPHLPGNT